MNTRYSTILFDYTIRQSTTNRLTIFENLRFLKSIKESTLFSGRNLKQLFFFSSLSGLKLLKIFSTCKSIFALIDIIFFSTH